MGVTAIVLALALPSLYLPFSPSSLVWPYEGAMVIGRALIGVCVWGAVLVRRARAARSAVETGPS